MAALRASGAGTPTSPTWRLSLGSSIPRNAVICVRVSRFGDILPADGVVVFVHGLSGNCRCEVAVTFRPTDCRTCGACCGGGYADDVHADCSVADVVAMSRAVRARVVASTHRPIRGIEAGYTPTDARGQCVFLQGTAGGGRRVACRIYETRPRVCRDFVPGSRRCKDAIAAMRA